MTPPRLDAAGNVYVSGRLTTGIFGFPQINPLQPAANQGQIFVSEYGPTGGTICFSTGIYSPSQSGVLFPAGLHVDSQGNIFVAGYTAAIDLPVTAGAFRTTNAARATFSSQKSTLPVPPRLSMRAALSPFTAPSQLFSRANGSRSTEPISPAEPPHGLAIFPPLLAAPAS
jgi:hypothetical protein